MNCAFSIPRPQNFFCFSNPQSKVFLADFPAGRRRMPLWAGGRIPTSDFFYMLYALCCRLYTLFARNPKPETRNSKLATRNSNRLQRPARFCTAFINILIPTFIILTSNKQIIIHKNKQGDHSDEDHSNNYRSGIAS